MDALLALTVANLKSFVRDRAALFWTIAFPVIFVVLFGTLFGGGTASFRVGWVDQDHTPASAALEQAFARTGVLSLKPMSEAAALAQSRQGQLDAVIVVPAGYGAAVARAHDEGASTTGPTSSSAPPRLPSPSLTLYTDPTRTGTAQAIEQLVTDVTTGVDQALSGRPPILSVQVRPLSGKPIVTGPSYYVPSILAMAIMQLGIFAAIPLVQQREKLILKRLGATPLPRWTLVGSNVLLRLVIAAGQTVIILAIGLVGFHVQVTGSWLLIAGIVALGALMFTALGYVIASFVRTEEAANGVTQVAQVLMMFLSGIFFPIELMPEWMKSIARLLPLTYLADGLRQVMVGSSPFVPLGVGMGILGAWLVACLAISARFFRWE